MSTGEGLEAVLEYIVVRLLADPRGDEYPCWIEELSHRVNCVVSDTVQVWLTSRQQIRSWLSEKILHTLRDEERSRKRKCEAHPTGVPLPELSPPNERLGRSTFGGWSRNPDKTHDEDDARRRNERNNYEKPCRYHFARLVWVRYVEVDGREGSFEWFDIFPTASNGCDGDDDDPVEDVGCDEAHRWHADSFDGPHVCESKCLMTRVR